MLGKGKWNAAKETAYPGFLRGYSRDSGQTNGGVYDDDGVGDAGKSKTAVKGVEQRPG